MVEGAYVACYRVSTDRQGQSGLGLDAQRQAVMDWLNGGGWQLLGEHTEVESGKNSERPQLAKALAECKRTGAKLIIARLDRLARKVSFISELMESGVDFVACDLPSATPFMLHIYAAVAEEEGRKISERTRAALQAAKRRGVKLGNPRPAKSTKRGRETQIARADQMAQNVMPIIREIQATGIDTLQGIADVLNARGVKTARGGKWYPTTVKNLAKRLIDN